MNTVHNLIKIIRTLFTFTFIKQFFDSLSEFLLENVSQIRKMELGINVSISSSARFMYAENIKIGSNTNINRSCFLWASENAKITLGNNCLTGPGVTIITAKYDVKGKELIRSYPEFESDVVIADDVWLGANCVILPGVKIGQGSIVGAGSVVTKSVNPYEVVAGIPARKIGSR